MPGFSRTANDLIDSGILDTLSLCATRVYRRMERLADGCGRCFPGIAKLAGWVGFAARSVSAAIKELVLAGLLVRVRRGGRSRSTVYSLVRQPGADLPLFSHLSHANPAQDPAGSHAMRVRTTQTQHQTQTQQQQPEGVVVVRGEEGGAEAVALIQQRTDAPLERAEAMARDYPLPLIREKLELLKGARNVRSSGAWLSCALANDYRAPAAKGLPRSTPEEQKERRRRELLAYADRLQRQRAEEARLRAEQKHDEPIGTILLRTLAAHRLGVPRG